MQVDRVEQGAPDVVLALVEGAVADPHRLRADVAAEVVEGPLGQLLLAADPVHDLQVRFLSADLDDEAHEVARLLVEAERVQRPEAEGRVADPAEAVVPVALAARRLRQRGGRRGEDRAGRRVGEALEDEGRALQVDAPGMVGEVAVAQPGAPELFGRLQPLHGLRGAARPAQVALAPGDRAEPVLALAQSQPAARGAALQGQVHVAGQAQLAALAAGGRLAQLAAAPGGLLDPVAEARQALHLHLHLAVDAGHQPQQGVVGVVFGLRAGAGSVLRRPLGDRQRVVDHHPAGVGHPGRLDDQRARLVAAADRHDDAARAQLEVTGAAVEQGGEGAGRVEAGQAEPLDGAGEGDQGAGVAVGEEAVAPDRREAVVAGAQGLPSYQRVSPLDRTRAWLVTGPLGRGLSFAIDFAVALRAGLARRR